MQEVVDKSAVEGVSSDATKVMGTLTMQPEWNGEAMKSVGWARWVGGMGWDWTRIESQKPGGQVLTRGLSWGSEFLGEAVVKGRQGPALD